MGAQQHTSICEQDIANTQVAFVVKPVVLMHRGVQRGGKVGDHVLGSCMPNFLADSACANAVTWQMLPMHAQ